MQRRENGKNVPFPDLAGSSTLGGHEQAKRHRKDALLGLRDNTKAYVD
jgi:hypothetical protein